jgi:hypothetical protein
LTSADVVRGSCRLLWLQLRRMLSRLLSRPQRLHAPCCPSSIVFKKDCRRAGRWRVDNDRGNSQHVIANERWLLTMMWCRHIIISNQWWAAASFAFRTGFLGTLATISLASTMHQHAS